MPGQSGQSRITVPAAGAATDGLATGAAAGTGAGERCAKNQPAAASTHTAAPSPNARNLRVPARRGADNSVPDGELSVGGADFTAAVAAAGSDGGNARCVAARTRNCSN